MFKIKNRETTLVFFLSLISITIPFLINMGNMAIILAVIVNIVFFKKENFRKLLSFEANFLLLFFAISFISSLLSKKSSYGYKHLDLVILLVLIALIVINTNITKGAYNKVLKYFYLSTVLSTTILILHALIRQTDGWNLNDITFHGFSQLYDQHPVYYAMYLSFSLLISTKLYRKKRDNLTIRNRWIYIFNSILLMGIILSASKAVLAFDLLAFSVWIFFNTKRIKSKICYITILGIVGFMLFNVPFLKKRYVEGIRFSQEIREFRPTNDYTKKKVFSYDQKESVSDLELRYIFGSIALYHIFEDNRFYLGYGQGDAKDYLNYYFFSYNLGPNWYENYNVHNQYIHILFVYGVFVLFLFLAYLIYSFIRAIKHKNTLHLFFLVLICFVFIFEVVLVRNKGIIFFYFFNSLFLFNYKGIENSNIRD